MVTVFALLGALGNQIMLMLQSASLNAAISIVNRIFGVANDIAVLFGFGALVLVAQFLGAGSVRAAQRAAVVALRASAVLGIALAAIAAVGAPAFMSLLQADPAVRDEALAYIRIAAGGIALYAYQMAAYSVLRAFGRTLTLLLPAIAINLLDLGLLALFLIVLDLGVVGAALPTLIVRGLVALLLAWLVRRVAQVSLFSALPEREGAPAARTMARLSVPSVVENSVFNVAVLVGASAVNAAGRDATNAHSFALTLTAIVTGVVLAIAQGNETIVGWDMGDRDVDHALRQTRRSIFGTVIAALLLALLLWTAAPLLLPLVGLGPEAVAMAADGLLVSILVLPLSAITTILYGALRSAGDVAVPMICSIASSALVLAPASYLLVTIGGLGVAGAFWALACAEAVKAGLLLHRWVRGHWRQVRVIETRHLVEH